MAIGAWRQVQRKRKQQAPPPPPPGHPILTGHTDKQHEELQMRNGALEKHIKVAKSNLSFYERFIMMKSSAQRQSQQRKQAGQTATVK